MAEDALLEGVAKLRGVALVTGAASGIGEAIAGEFNQRGMRTVLADRDCRGQEVADAMGDTAQFVELDVADREWWERVAAWVWNEYGKVDVLALNAGLMSRPRGAPLSDDPIDWVNAESFDRVLGVNLNGVVYGILSFLPYFMRQNSGKILITSSVDGLIAYPQDPLYAMTKSAQISLTRSLAELLGRYGTKINSVCPYSVLTELTPADFREVPNRGISATDFARGVIHVLESDTTGGVWLMRRAGAAPELHEFEEVPDAAELYANR